jgi:hypothetical protein
MATLVDTVIKADVSAQVPDITIRLYQVVVTSREGE